jgi:hypothetical protein
MQFVKKQDGNVWFQGQRHWTGLTRLTGENQSIKPFEFYPAIPVNPV